MLFFEDEFAVALFWVDERVNLLVENMKSF